jgi:hypothetical protein
MKLDDYLLNVEGRDWARLLSTWGWLLRRPFAVQLANRFGDLFLTFEDGSVHQLDVGSGVLERVAASIGEFVARLEEPGPADQWLLRPLVDVLVATGQVPGPDQCYSYRMLPVFGGEYAPDNVILRDLATHYAAFGPIHERIKDLPDGSQVSFSLQG